MKKSYPHRGSRGEEGLMEPLSIKFLICCSISKQFGFRWKAFDLLDKMRYTHGWWPCCRPVTSSRLPSWILPKSRNQARKARKWFFLLFLTCKWHINKYFASFYLEALLLSLKKKVEKKYFHLKMARPPAAYDVIYRNHSNWSWLNSIFEARTSLQKRRTGS